ncbi:hypothetical protein K493DRAFT_297204 [Basidiobolus meristosporus CBS 931.73]|uniref:LysM domain-containing protein n=1 Tax=Basidiobolus meristosporus CBS 931.73 TaxID=1314790 RepID=A0A1Y1Z113_9FUNG|nr:hypothetical protein K493DRAFT_297204 [Basidiobolus meristosporus CBS 931.73]|eukprot:ORY03973.1 hypothetical protein K493DRAFT_297204 [Basidiobolus meristosporus CBS 931.73]
MCAAVAFSSLHFSNDLENNMDFQGFMEPGVFEHQPFQPSYFIPDQIGNRQLRRKNTTETTTDPLLNSSFPFVPIRRQKTEDDIASEIEDALSSHFSSSSSLALELQEKRVIVHRIKDTDTLAGIALLYGVNTDELKRINKIWSDNLHLKKSLYIPLELVNYQEVFLRLKALKATNPRIKPQNSEWTDVSLAIPTKQPVVEIVSVPEAELKFFSVSQNDPQDSRVAPPAEFIQEDLPSFKEIFGVNKLIKLANKLKHHKKTRSSQNKAKIHLELQENLKL